MRMTTALGLARRPRAAVRDLPARRSHRPPAPAPPRHTRRRHEGPQDRALYTCPCGFAWTGTVTTSVACPHCGTGQAW